MRECMCVCVQLMTRDRKCPVSMTEFSKEVHLCVYCKLPRSLLGQAGLLIFSQFVAGGHPVTGGSGTQRGCICGPV